MDGIETKTDQELATLRQEVFSDKEPAPDPVKDTQDISPAAKSDTGSEADTSKTGADDPVKPETVYAGKYKTPEDLEKGFGELVKNLNIPAYLSSPLTKAIEEAKKSGDWKNVEETYQQLQADYTKRQQSEAQKVKETPKPQEQPVQLDEVKRLQVNNFLKEDFTEQISKHPIRQDVIDAGYPFPTDKDELARMKLENRALYNDLQKVVVEIQQDGMKYVQEWLKAERDLPLTKSKVETDGKAFITQINEKYKLGLKPEEIEAHVKAALDNPDYQEDKFGFKFPKNKAVERYFHAEVMPELLEKVRQIWEQDAENRGRTQHTEDLRKIKEKSLETASTSNLANNVNRSTSKVDLTKPDEVAGMSDKDLELERRKLFGG